MNEREMPPLPEPAFQCGLCGAGATYTAEQMRAYAAACVAAEIGRALIEAIRAQE